MPYQDRTLSPHNFNPGLREARDFPEKWVLLFEPSASFRRESLVTMSHPFCFVGADLMQGTGQLNFGSNKLDEPSSLLLVSSAEAPKDPKDYVRAFGKVRQSQRSHTSMALGRNLSPLHHTP